MTLLYPQDTPAGFTPPSHNSSGTGEGGILTSSDVINSIIFGTRLASEGTGDNVLISFSFIEEGSRFSIEKDGGYGDAIGGSEAWADRRDFTDAEKDAIRTVLESIEKYIDISFIEVPEAPLEVGTMRFGWTEYTRPRDDDDDGEPAAWAYLPTFSGGPKESDIWLAMDTLSSNSSSGFFQFALLHEIGHALGLKHPHSAGPYSGIMPAHLDGQDHSVMSYNPSSWFPNATRADLYPQTLMFYDIAALQAMYGANNEATAGDDHYLFDSSKRYLMTIWDVGGNDTFEIIGNGNYEIDLRTSTISDVGTIVNYTGGGQQWQQNYTVYITHDTYLENAISGDGNDLIYGNIKANFIDAGGGNDTILDDAGNDTIWAGAGNDTIEGGGGIDRIYDGQGNDVVKAQNGADILFGSLGADTLDGGNGTDTVSYKFAGSAVTANLETGGTAGQAAGDVYLNIENLTGSKRSDHLTGNDGNNKILGKGANDTILGGAGDDILEGNGGDDWLSGGAGDDTLTGGKHADTFHFEESGGHDVITDFNVNEDILDLSAFGFADLEAVEAISSMNAGNLVITIDAETSIVLHGVSLDQFLQIGILI